MAPSHDPIIGREIVVIAQIIRDETWLEGERRGCPVAPTDPAVREKVCATILRVGAEMRERFTREYGILGNNTDPV